MSEKEGTLFNSDFQYDKNDIISNSPANDQIFNNPLTKLTHTYTEEVSYIVANQSTSEMLQHEINRLSEVASEGFIEELILLPALRMVTSNYVISSIDLSTGPCEEMNSVFSFNSDSDEDIEQ